MIYVYGNMNTIYFRLKSIVTPMCKVVRVYGECRTDCRARASIVKGGGHNISSSKKKIIICFTSFSVGHL